MDVLSAHQDRTAHLRETLERLIGLHRRLYELRSDSWREQVEGDPHRAEHLQSLHRQIDDVEAETELLREVFRQGLDVPAQGTGDAGLQPLAQEAGTPPMGG